MYSPLSATWEPAIRSSGKRVLTADLYYVNGSVATNVPVASAHITSDANAEIRRNASITLVNPDLVRNDQSTSGRPNYDLTNPVSIYGTEMVLKAGVEYAFGNQELVPLGRFVIWDVDNSFEDGDVFDLQLYDRAKYLAHGQIPKFYDASSMSGKAAIQALVTLGMPTTSTVSFSAGLNDITLPGGTTYDNTYLDAIMDIAEALGAEFYFDLAGNPVCAPKPFISDNTSVLDVDFTADCGESGVNVTLGKRTTRDEVFNGFGVYGAVPNNSSTQPFAEVYNLNASSPTYYNGPFGKAFKRIDRPELTTNAQCLTAAKAELNAVMGRAQGSTFTMLPNPALEPGDVILVGFPDGSTEFHLIDSIDFAFGEESFSVTTKGSINAY